MEIKHSLSIELSNLRNTKPSFCIDNFSSFDEWKIISRAKLSELLGLDRFSRCDDEFMIESDEILEKYRKIRFTFQSEEECFVPCYFIIPKKSSCPKPPVMICLQGHGTGMHISLGIPKYDIDMPKIENGDRDFVNQCVERGICSLVIEQRCFGERGGNPRPNCHGAALTALLTGRTVIGGRVWDIMRAVDVVEKYFSDFCNIEKIFCMGNSGGGTASIYASALEDRIRAAIPSCAFCTFADSIGALNHCECNYIPHIAEYFDMAELAGMSAPKPLVIVSGKTDGIFPIESAESEFLRLKKIYSAAYASEKCIHVKGDEGHRFYAEQGWDAFEKIVELK